jgi:hypothetical protein
MMPPRSTRYGVDAAVQAGMRADELLAEGDVDGAATWRAIIRAVEDLQRATPREGDCVPWSWYQAVSVYQICHREPKWLL